jgi:benzoyl-CoA reductase/2-hydroxyglutaryl-CoA dehydratase subunit BcrC/BadD/HgdB
MKKVIRLTESDLVRLVKRVINERDLEKEFDEFSSDEESPIDCEHLFKSMDFIYDDFMSHISLSPDEIDEADAEDLYDEFETELGGILDEANQMDCDNIEDLEIVYNEYLSEMANKLGLR